MAISNNSTGIRTGVCTSTTRPTAPYEGQHIYETDTDIEYVWNGSAWVVNYVSAASPAFTGTPTAPTASAGTNTTQLATTAFVQTALGSWTAYTPTLTNITLGNGTMTARYYKIGKIVGVNFFMELGSTSSISGSGACGISLPVTADSVSGAPILGTAQYFDAGNLRYFGFVIAGSTTSFGLGYDAANRYQEIYSVGPFTWGTGDQINANFFYGSV